MFGKSSFLQIGRRWEHQSSYFCKFLRQKIRTWHTPQPYRHVSAIRDKIMHYRRRSSARFGDLANAPRYERLYAVNIHAVISGIRAAAAVMGEGGRIVSILSPLSFEGLLQINPSGLKPLFCPIEV